MRLCTEPVKEAKERNISSKEAIVLRQKVRRENAGGEKHQYQFCINKSGGEGRERERRET